MNISQPRLVVNTNLTSLRVDLMGIAKIMKSLGLSEETIQTTTVYIDSRQHLTVRGSVWPKFLAKLRYPRLAPSGCVIRLSGNMFFTGPTDRTINHTLIHEIEHVAQIERKDVRIFIGYLTSIIFSANGVALGLASNPSVVILEVLITGITGLFGLQLGYLLSLHEMQARKTSANYKLDNMLITSLKKK